MSSPHRVVFFDLETGGLDKDKHPIIQAAFVATTWPMMTVLEEFEIKIRFDESECVPEALAANHYDPAVWNMKAFPPVQAMRAIGAFLKRHATIMMLSKAGRPYRLARLAGHNAAGFDTPFIHAWFKRNGQFFPGHFATLDTYILSLWLMHDNDAVRSHKLVDLCEHLGIPLNRHDAHDALADVRATVALARMLMELRDVALHPLEIEE